MGVGCIKSVVCVLSRFSRQEYWTGLPFPPPEYLPDPGIKPVSPLSPALRASMFFTGENPQKDRVHFLMA